MIRNEKEYEVTRQRIDEIARIIVQQRAELEAMGLEAEEVQRGIDPMVSFQAQLADDVAWYDRVRKRDFGAIQGLAGVGQLLIAARIANGLSQRELAARLGVSEAQVSRDERNEYHGITIDRAQRILDCLQETVTLQLAGKA